MALNQQAYDFTLFEDHYGGAAPVREPRPERQRRPDRRVVEFPVERPRPSARPKRHPGRVLLAALSFAVFTAIAVAMVYSQQRLAVLTEEINAATQALEEGQSLEVQLNMAAAQKMNSAQVEEYAVQELGMSKVSLGQLTYVNVARRDQGTVVQAVEGGSVLDGLLARLRALAAS